MGRVVLKVFIGILLLLLAFTFYAYSKTLDYSSNGATEIDPLHMYDDVYLWLVGLISVAIIISVIVLFIQKVRS